MISQFIHQILTEIVLYYVTEEIESTETCRWVTIVCYCELQPSLALRQCLVDLTVVVS